MTWPFSTTRIPALTWRTTLRSTKASGLCWSSVNGKAASFHVLPFSPPIPLTKGCAAPSTWERPRKSSRVENMSTWCKNCRKRTKTPPLRVVKNPDGKAKCDTLHNYLPKMSYDALILIGLISGSLRTMSPRPPKAFIKAWPSWRTCIRMGCQLHQSTRISMDLWPMLHPEIASLWPPKEVSHLNRAMKIVSL